MVLTRRVALFCCLLTCLVACDLITSLPGLTPFPSWAQYSGYINITSGSTTKSLFYWFVESQSNPSTDPLVLWLQGGPGCSGFIGLFQENGPFLIGSDGETLSLNPFSWNKNASVIYIESPAGVGFSYSADESGYTTNDNITAEDNYAFLNGFFQEFPSFKQNEFWITGESYGGVYVPTLSYQILTGTNSNLRDHFQGIMVGNPVMYCEDWKQTFFNIQLELYYWHGLVSYSNRQLWFTKGCDKGASVACETLFNSFKQSIGPFDIDDLYTNFCTGNGTLNFLETVPNCFNINARTPYYLNLPKVQQAIHVTNKPAKGEWTVCTHRPTIHYTSLFMNMLNYYNYFFAHSKLRVLIYSGDADIADVPHAFTQHCLAQLERPIITPWTRWTVPGPHIPGNETAKDQITAGYQEIYDKYTYITVRGAGHEAPQYQPLFASTAFTRFVINGGNL